MKGTSGKKQKKQSALMSGEIADKIPYIQIFEEEGVVEVSKGSFSRAYVIEDISADTIKSYNSDLIAKRFSMLLNELPDGVSAQFVIHNRLISSDSFLKKVLIVADKEAEVNGWIEKYNKTVVEGAEIGHNNTKKLQYFVLNTHADIPEDAIKLFRGIDETVKKLFLGIMEIKAEGLSAVGLLKVLYSMLNPKQNDFGKKIRMEESETITLRAIKRAKKTTKDCIMPRSFISEPNYMVLNGDTYARSFFITSLPANVTQNLISDITSISSNMLFSIIYEPVDAKYGFDVASRRVAENTVIQQAAKRDTIKDRRAKTVVKTETLIKQSENAYFEKAALHTMQESVALNMKAMLCTLIIVLFADDYDALERDTKLLHISTSKFACQTKCLDLQQVEGFQSALPLCQAHIDCRRLFTIEKLSKIPPLNIQEILRKDGLFYGLNTINDNLVLLNRKNSPNMAGLIAGTEHSGKTFQCKREIFNALISTNDRVFILTGSDEYDDFAKTLGGSITSNLSINPFEMVDHYGLINADKYSKSLMLEALLECATRSRDKIIADPIRAGEADDSADEASTSISSEIDILMKAVESGQISLNQAESVLRFIRENADLEKFQSIFSLLAASLNAGGALSDKRLQVIKIKSPVELLLTLDFLYNTGIRDKMMNRSAWIFVDSIDGLLLSEQSAAFLTDYIQKTNALKNVLTLVMQSAVKLFTDNGASYRTGDMVSECGYHKLLNQGAIERKAFTKLLNIPHSLVNYITGADLGRGIILTSASNTAFDDCFTDDEEMGSFYQLFKI